MGKNQPASDKDTNPVLFYPRACRPADYILGFNCGPLKTMRCRDIRDLRFSGGLNTVGGSRQCPSSTNDGLFYCPKLGPNITSSLTFDPGSTLAIKSLSAPFSEF